MSKSMLIGSSHILHFDSSGRLTQLTLFASAFTYGGVGWYTINHLSYKACTSPSLQLVLERTTSIQHSKLAMALCTSRRGTDLCNGVTLDTAARQSPNSAPTLLSGARVTTMGG